mgnify:CR=1 FL=1|tara:strand:- start:24714 stop:25433 length:720 start_codon:yes stop_codon:yes gene_type:complete
MGRISDIIKQNMKIEVEEFKTEITNKEKNYWIEVKKDKPPPPDCFSYENMQRGFKFWAKSSLTNNEYIIDDNNRNIIKLLNIYFSKNDKLMEENFPQYSTRKGILICGKCGTGKTLLLKIYKEIVKNLKSQAFRIISSNQIVREFDEHGSQSLKKYIDYRFMFDDFGSENIGKHYGKDEEVFKTLLEERYNLFIDKKTPTYLTSNLSLSQIKNRYGDRVASRINEMFNIIVIGGNDRRK